MKSLILIACLVLSTSAAPQKTAGLERESSAPKSEKLQFSPADAQVYTAGRPVVQTVDQVIAGNAALPQVVSYAAEQVVPSYYSSAAPAIPSAWNTAVYPGQVVPYSTGRTTVTSTSQNGLPTGTVYEHHGTSHIGHAAGVVHVKRPGHLYSQTPYYTSPLYANGAVATPGAIVPAHMLPAQSWSQSYYNGQIQYINGQPAQHMNGQWYWASAPVVPQVNPSWNQYSSVYTNLLGRANGVIPQTTLANGAKAFIQPGTSYTQSVLGYRPAIQDNYRPAVIDTYRPAVIDTYRPAVQDNKWYTKTNTQQVAQPFYGQPQYTQIPAAAGTKQYAVPRPDVEAEKADW